MNENERVVKDVPDFLKEVNFTKPDENAKHHEKLIERARGFDAEDAAIVCQIFARKFPDVMFNALKAEIVDLRALRDDVTKSVTLYSAKEDAI